MRPTARLRVRVSAAGAAVAIPKTACTPNHACVAQLPRTDSASRTGSLTVMHAHYEAHAGRAGSKRSWGWRYSCRSSRGADKLWPCVPA